MRLCQLTILSKILFKSYFYFVYRMNLNINKRYDCISNVFDGYGQLTLYKIIISVIC